MDRRLETLDIREKLVFKTVHNIRNLREKEETCKGMYRSGIKLDLQRSRLLTESYRETEGEPMVIRRAKALKRILTRMDLYIQDWERIVGNNVPTPQGLYFGIDMNWRSVRRVVRSEEGSSLLSPDEALAGGAHRVLGRQVHERHPAGHVQRRDPEVLGHVQGRCRFLVALVRTRHSRL